MYLWMYFWSTTIKSNPNNNNRGILFWLMLALASNNLAKDEITFDNFNNLSDGKNWKLGAILKPKIAYVDKLALLLMPRLFPFSGNFWNWCCSIVSDGSLVVNLGLSCCLNLSSSVWPVIQFLFIVVINWEINILFWEIITFSVDFFNVVVTSV